MTGREILWAYIAKFTGATGYPPGSVTVSGGGFVFARNRTSAVAKARQLCPSAAELRVSPWVVLGFIP